MKKIISLLLIATILLSFAACTTKEEKINLDIDYEIGDTGGLEVPFGNGETITWIGSSETAESTYMFDRLSEITGLNVEPTYMPSSSAKEKVNVLLAGGKLPDILGAGVGTLSEIKKISQQGAYAAVTDYLDKMPNFMRIFDTDENRWMFKTYAADDGKLYCLPAYDISRPVNHGMLYRKDIFEKHNIPMWNSPETFYQALKKLKEIYPDSYPLTSKNTTKILSNYSVAWGISAYQPYFDEETNLWKYSDTSAEMKEMLDFFRKLYAEGLLDIEFLTNTQPAWTQKMTTGKSFVSYDWIGRLDEFSRGDAYDPDYDLRYGNPVGPKQTLVTLAKIGEGGCVVANNKNAELSMKLMDFMYSEAGAQLSTLGIEGQTYKIGEDGMAEYLGFEEGQVLSSSDLSQKYGLIVNGMYRTTDKRSISYKFSEREQEAQDWYKNCGGFEPMDPVMSFDDKTSNDVVKYITALSKEFETVMFNYIVGSNTGDKAWNEWLNTAKKLGEDQLIKIYNDRYNKFYK